MARAISLCLLLTACAAAENPLLFVLEPTGHMRDGYPVLRQYPDQAHIVATLSRGFSGRMLRLYHRLQPEPAYLLFSSQEGGFPRFGFWLGGQDKRQAAYVDLHRNSTLTGRFGAVDQIFPHELGHIILHQLAGEPPTGGANQIHAVGVQTDSFTAFDEGFAEHFQVMAAEDPDADPATRALISNEREIETAYARIEAYRREMSALWAPAARYRMTFPLWFSGTEQLLRWHAVKENRFAYEPEVGARDPYAAYLLANIVPGTPGGRPKSAARMLSTEGVISALFYRWLRSEGLPLDDAYMKIFRVFAEQKPHTAVEFIHGYKTVFPAQAAAVDSLVSSVLQGQPLPDAPEIWLANDRFLTGTSVFDQFRRAPRVHTFDLNAASMVDLDWMPPAIADSILKAAPYRSLDDLKCASDIRARFREMAAAMARVREDRDKMESGSPFRAILLSFAWRALWFWLLASFVGALLYRCARPVRIHRAIINGIVAAFVALAGAWMAGGYWSLLAPMLCLGVPAATWQLARGTWRPAATALLAWLVAALPVAVLTHPWF